MTYPSYKRPFGIKVKKLFLGKRLNRTIGDNIFTAIFLAVMGFLMVFPLVYIIINSFKPIDELLLFPPKFFVSKPTLENYSELFGLLNDTWVPFTRYLGNTVFITAVSTVFHILFSSMAAYALCKHTFFGSRVLFKIVVLSLMFTGAVTAVPNYLLISSMGLIDTLWSVILPAIQSSLGLYLMKQFMEPIPEALLESARIDGAGEFCILFRIVMPQAKPAWLTLIILQIQAMWPASSTYLISEENKTVSMVMEQIVSSGIARMGAASAVTAVMMIVPMAAFILSQTRIIETMSTSGMKE